MNFAISWVLSLFKKPEVEITFDKAEIKPWAFPVETKKRKPRVQKATTRKPAVKKPVAKKVVAKKKTK